MITRNHDRQTVDLVNTLEAIALLADVAKRSPEIIILAGLVLLFVGLFMV